MAERGDIYHHERLKFHNGAVKDKYIVLLNTPTKNDPYIFVKTTSQKKDKPTTPGCVKDRSLYFLPAGSTFFPEDTWIQLYTFYPISAKDVEKRANLAFKATLKRELIDKIIDCLFKAEADNIEDEYRQLLKPPLQEGLTKLLEKWGKRH